VKAEASCIEKDPQLLWTYHFAHTNLVPDGGVLHPLNLGLDPHCAEVAHDGFQLGPFPPPVILHFKAVGVPASARSFLALAGSYSYFTTSSVQTELGRITGRMDIWDAPLTRVFWMVALSMAWEMACRTFNLFSGEFRPFLLAASKCRKKTLMVIGEFPR